MAARRLTRSDTSTPFNSAHRKSASAFGLTRFIASFLFGVASRDPVVFAAVPLLLCGVAFAGVWLPARRAAHVDPVIALRTE